MTVAAAFRRFGAQRLAERTGDACEDDHQVCAGLGPLFPGIPPKMIIGRLEDDHLAKTGWGGQADVIVDSGLCHRWMAEWRIRAIWRR
jgi:hypothetical protein